MLKEGGPLPDRVLRGAGDRERRLASLRADAPGVADRAGEIRFLHRSRTTTDVPESDALLAPLDAI